MTPAAHTTSYFKHLAYRHDYRRAVEEGYLVDYDVVNIRSDVQMNGVFLQEGEQVERVDPQSGATQLDLLKGATLREHRNRGQGHGPRLEPTDHRRDQDIRDPARAAHRPSIPCSSADDHR